jgi:hypothetical protein
MRCIHAVQAIRAGMTRAMIRNRLERGLWLQLHRGGFTPAGTVKTWRRDVMAALLACGPDAFASHRSAGVIWGFREEIDVPEITVPVRTRRVHRGVTVYRTHRVERVNRQGFRVSPPMRTLLDLAVVLPVNLVECAVDTAHRRGLIELRRFAVYLELPEHSALPGSGELRRMVACRGPSAAIASDLETLFFAVLRRVNFPLPLPQHRVFVPNGKNRYVDFAFPRQQIAIELDG